MEGKAMRRKKRFIILLLVIVIAAATAASFRFWPPSEDAPLPEYSANIETRVMGRNAGLFTEEDMENLGILAGEIGRLVYGIGDGYDPQDVSDWLLHTTPGALRDMASRKNARSSVTSHKVLDVLVDGPDRGDALVSYVLDFEDDDSPRGVYYSVAEIHFLRTETGWVAEGVTARDSASAEGFELVRDGVTGNIRFNPVG